MTAADRARRLLGEVWDAAQDKKTAADPAARGRYVEWGAGVLEALIEEEVQRRLKGGRDA